MMRRNALISALAAFVVAGRTSAFISPLNPVSFRVNSRCSAKNALFSTSSQPDCGCGGAMVTGKPSDAARLMDPRVAISKGTFLALNGETVSMDDVLGDPKSAGLSLVVFLRSFG